MLSFFIDPETALEWSLEHQYEPGQYSNDRRRLQPKQRFSFIMNAYIDLSTGEAPCENPPYYGEIGANQIARLCSEGAIHTLSVATIFRYFPDRATLNRCLIAWAEANTHSSCKVSRRAARHIGLQYHSIYGQTKEFTFPVKASWSKP